MNIETRIVKLKQKSKAQSRGKLSLLSTEELKARLGYQWGYSSWSLEKFKAEKFRLVKGNAVSQSRVEEIKSMSLVELKAEFRRLLIEAVEQSSRCCP